MKISINWTFEFKRKFLLTRTSSFYKYRLILNISRSDYRKRTESQGKAKISVDVK